MPKLTVSLGGKVAFSGDVDSVDVKLKDGKLTVVPVAASKAPKSEEEN